MRACSRTAAAIAAVVAALACGIDVAATRKQAAHKPDICELTFARKQTP